MKYLVGLFLITFHFVHSIPFHPNDDGTFHSIVDGEIIDHGVVIPHPADFSRLQGFPGSLRGSRRHTDVKKEKVALQFIQIKVINPNIQRVCYCTNK